MPEWACFCRSSSESEDDEPTDPWERIVKALDIDRSGGLRGSAKVPMYCQVLAGADTQDKRMVTLKVHPLPLISCITCKMLSPAGRCCFDGACF